MTLATRTRSVETETGVERRLFVACPQRIDPVALEECARCELCEGLELDSQVGVRCAVEPPDGQDGAPDANAPVTTIMTTPVVSVEPDASIENVQWLLLDRGIGAAPVVDARRRPIGVVAKTDLLRDRDEPALSVELSPEAPREGELREGRTSGLRAADVMTPVVHAVLDQTSIAGAATVMARERVHDLVIVDEAGEMIGIVSTFDLARWVAARGRFVPRRADRSGARRPR
jgi:CBS domain-containing protein